MGVSMSSFDRANIANSRRIYRNPYAHIELLDAETSASIPTHRADAKPAAVAILHNQYAFVEDEDDSSITGKPKAPHDDAQDDLANYFGTFQVEPKKERYSNADIEARAKHVHKALWRNRHKIWGDAVPTDPVELLSPGIVAELLGYQYVETSGIGQHDTPDHTSEVAGMIDNEQKTISISGQFRSAPRRFTAAHEIGHAVLHRQEGVIHRDRPIDHSTPNRPITEYEADKFATYFLMPEKLVRDRFTSLFGEPPFHINNETAFALERAPQQAVRKKYPTVSLLAKVLASTEQYNFEHFPSLARQFRVSETAMAIRLEELGLIQN